MEHRMLERTHDMRYRMWRWAGHTIKTIESRSRSPTQLLYLLIRMHHTSIDWV